MFNVLDIKDALYHALNSICKANEPSNPDAKAPYKGSPAQRAREIVNHLDTASLAQSICQNLRTVYVYETSGSSDTILKYHGPELFTMPACRIFVIPEIINPGIVKMEYSRELWLLKDMRFAETGCVLATAETGKEHFCSTFRTFKNWMDMDYEWRNYNLGDIENELKKLCYPEYPDPSVYYEIEYC